MKNKYVKIAVFTALGLSALYGGYKLYNFIKRGSDSNESDEDEVIDKVNENKSVSEPKFDGDKIVSVGSRGGEVKTIQTAINNIIIDSDKSKDKGLTGEKEARRKAVASIEKLSTDGIFGAKTESAVLKIMGKKAISYNQIKQKRKDFASAYGLPNPYKK